MNITVNNVELYYEVVGSGAPLVMIHGNGESHEIFREAVQLLSQRFTCYLLDSRGHGRSQPVTEYHYTDMAQDVYCFIRALELKNVTYYGFSDGGIIGLLLAIDHPEVLDRMIISGANTCPEAVSKPQAMVFRLLNFLHKNPLFQLILTEPHISAEQLQSITVTVYESITDFVTAIDYDLTNHTREDFEVLDMISEEKYEEITGS